MNTLVPILALAAGFLVGYTGILPDIYFSIDWPEVLLFALMLQVGMGLGVRPDLMDIFKSLNIKTLLLPIFTILGTLLFSTLAIFIFRMVIRRIYLPLGVASVTIRYRQCLLRK